MSTNHPVTIGGAFSSPYSLKMRAVLRYRHIPFRWVLRNSRVGRPPAGPVPVIPLLVFPDDDGGYGEAMSDSSPQIMRLEREYAGRSIVPTDPALAFIDFLLEDFADEWVTKMMYHYRWAYDADIEKAGRCCRSTGTCRWATSTGRELHDYIIERQVGRRALVGSTDANQPVIEESYLRVLDLLQAHLGGHHFLLGDRPGRSDFALYGQLKPMLWWDPTPMAIAVERAPKAVNWIERVDDLSWWPTADDGAEAWAGRDRRAGLGGSRAARRGGPHVRAVHARQRGRARVGRRRGGVRDRRPEFRQGPFKYQGKCLRWVRDEYAALDGASRAKVDTVLAGTGCEAIVA